MSITDELRGYAQGWRETPNQMDDLDAGDIDGLLGDLEHIADRIDAEHEEALNKISRAGQLLADAEKDRDENYANWQDCKQRVLQGNITFGELDAEIERLKDELARCVELPKDADGVPIHVGDVMAYADNTKPMEVVALVPPAVFLTEDGPRYADMCRHYHAPTVEDVLTEFGIDWEHESDCEDRAALLKEYASKLQLREDA